MTTAAPATGGEGGRFRVEVKARHPLFPESAGLWKFLFVLDGGHGFAVRELEEWTPEGKLARRTENGSLERLGPPDVWLPKRSLVSEFYWTDTSSKVLARFSEKAIRDIEYVVKDQDNRPIDEKAFVLTYDEPGTIVTDNRPPEAKARAAGRIEYVIPANPSDLDEAISAAKQGRRATVSASPRSSRRVLLVVNGAAVAIIAGLLLMRRARKSR